MQEERSPPSREDNRPPACDGGRALKYDIINSNRLSIVSMPNEFRTESVRLEPSLCGWWCRVGILMGMITRGYGNFMRRMGRRWGVCFRVLGLWRRRFGGVLVGFWWRGMIWWGVRGMRGRVLPWRVAGAAAAAAAMVILVRCVWNRIELGIKRERFHAFIRFIRDVLIPGLPRGRNVRFVNTVQSVEDLIYKFVK